MKTRTLWRASLQTVYNKCTHRPPLHYWLVRYSERLAGCEVKGWDMYSRLSKRLRHLLLAILCAATFVATRQLRACGFISCFLPDKVVKTATLQTWIWHFTLFSSNRSIISQGVSGLFDTFPQNISTISQLSLGHISEDRNLLTLLLYFPIFPTFLSISVPSAVFTYLTPDFVSLNFRVLLIIGYHTDFVTY